jgi:hypothetical protein
MTNKDIVLQFIDAYNNFDIERMLSFVHPDIKFTNISGGDVNTRINGKTEFEKLARKSLTLFKEREQKVLSFIENNNKINMNIEYSAGLAIDLPNGLKAGEKLYMTGKSEYIIKDGLIVSLND